MKGFNQTIAQTEFRRTMNGGTDPSGALKDAFAEQLRMRRDEHIGLNIIFLATDGCFGSYGLIENTITDARDTGMYVVLIGIGDDFELDDIPCDERHDIKNVSELKDAMESVVKKIQLKARKDAIV